MPLPINIRSAIASDAHRLLAIRWDAIISLVDDFGHVAERWANSASPDRATLAIEHNTVWVAESESMVVGWIEVNSTPPVKDGACVHFVKGAKVNGLYVDSSVSRSGVGSSLIAYAELTIQTQGKVAVHLDASPNAVSFYARLGYEVAGAPKQDNSVPMVKRFGHDT